MRTRSTCLSTITAGPAATNERDRGHAGHERLRRVHGGRGQLHAERELLRFQLVHVHDLRQQQRHRRRLCRPGGHGGQRRADRGPRARESVLEDGVLSFFAGNLVANDSARHGEQVWPVVDGYCCGGDCRHAWRDLARGWSGDVHAGGEACTARRLRVHGRGRRHLVGWRIRGGRGRRECHGHGGQRHACCRERRAADVAEDSATGVLVDVLANDSDEEPAGRLDRSR